MRSASTTAAMRRGGWRNGPTVHEGVAAQVLERRGILSDRCELNRQIKADNAPAAGAESGA